VDTAGTLNVDPETAVERHEVVVRVENLVKSYHAEGELVRALSGVSLDVKRGEFLGVMGASGSGKSTLLHLIGGLDQASSGAVVLSGKNLAKLSDRERTLFRRDHVGIVFQAFNLLPTLTALENVMLPAMIGGKVGPDVKARAVALLESVDLGHRMRHRPQAMAGGEQQRVAIARALINDPVVLLADEPTGNLDTHHGDDVWRLLARLVHERGTTIIAVTHEPSGATFTDRVVVLKDGRVAGSFTPGGEGHAAVVASRYTELVQ